MAARKRRKPTVIKPAKKKPAAKQVEKAKHTATLRELSPLARHANAALVNADKSQTRSDDLRLTAAQDLAKAEEICKRDKLSFKTWCEENITKSWETARQLVRVGKSDDPQAAIEDLRAAAAKRQKKSRDGQASARQRVTQVQRSANDDGNPYIVALDAAKALDDKDQERLAEEMANRTGHSLVTAERKKAYENANDGVTLGKAKIIEALGLLSVSDRRDVLRQLTEMVEKDARRAGIDPMSAEDMKPPKALQRPKPKKRKAA